MVLGPQCSIRMCVWNIVDLVPLPCEDGKVKEPIVQEWHEKERAYVFDIFKSTNFAH